MLLTHGRSVCLMLGSLAASVALADPATTSPTRNEPVPTTQMVDLSLPEVDTLISRLTDPHWQVRNRAVERLVQLGSAAEPQLRVAWESTRSVDLRARVELALNRIREVRHSGATYVTLHLRSARAREALDQVSREADVKFDFAETDIEHNAAQITLDADHRPFWAVLRDVCGPAKLAVTSIDPSGTIVLGAGDEDWAIRPAAVEGPYMFVARRVELARSLDFARPKDVSDAYALVLMAYAEPKLKPIYWVVRGIDDCRTETGRRLTMAQDEGAVTGELNSDSETRLQFTGPADASRRIARLRLNTRFVLREKSQPMNIAGVLKVKNETRTIGGWRLAIKGVTKTDDERFAAAVTVYRDAHSPDEWSERMTLLDRTPPRLLDSTGTAMESGGPSLNEGPDEWNWTDEFTPSKPNAGPSNLEWDFPLETRHADVSFEFKDLPLP